MKTKESIVVTGKCGTAIVYADILEESARKQIETMLNYEFVKDSVVRIMPDVHAGKGCTIGTTMTVRDKIVPNLVGVDIGCGMLTVKFEEKDVDLKALDEICHAIPSGMNVWEEARKDESILDELALLCCYDSIKNIDWIRRSLGTLGGGNHFIEMDLGKDGALYLVIHSGSRNLGKQVADIYQKQAIAYHGDKGRKAFKELQDKLVESYKKEGMPERIPGAIRNLKEVLSPRNVPDDLCWLEGDMMRRYMCDLDICQRFAARNREIIAHEIFAGLKLHVSSMFHTVHNYIDLEDMVLRKGAIKAKQGTPLLIPMNMREGSILGVGKGNPNWNCSAPHGAGRVMSRSEARRRLSLEKYEKTMEGVYSTSVGLGTIDEAPMVYKPMEDILEWVQETVEVIDVIKPVYNFKASE